jgi:hypothetical protein
MCAGIYGTSQVSTQDEFNYSAIIGGIVLAALVGTWFVLLSTQASSFEDIGRDSEKIIKIYRLIWPLLVLAILVWASVYSGLRMAHCESDCDGVKGGFAAAVTCLIVWVVVMIIGLFVVFP